MKGLAPREGVNLGLVVGAGVVYISLTVMAPHSNAPSPYHIPVLLLAALALTIVGLFLLTWALGWYAWLELDRYARRFTDDSARKAFGQMAQGMWLLASGLIVSSIIGTAKPFYATNAELADISTGLNYVVIVLFPFLGFMRLQTGSLHLAVSAQASMTTRAKLVTVGPPVALLSAFYMFMVFTSAATSTETPVAWVVARIVVPLCVVLVVGSWVLGLLAALNVERATYRGQGAKHARPLVGLYNGILTTTGGFIILDALLSVGTARLQALPVVAIFLLLYAFIGVVGLGFWMVGRSVRQLRALPAARVEG